jgi:hypothetical protein
VALICVILSTAATYGDAFQNSEHGITKRNSLLGSSTSLSASLSTPTGSNFTDFHDGENGNSGRNKRVPSTHIQIVPMDHTAHEGRDPNFNQFHKYLKTISQRTRNSNTRAFLMDDELKRLETRYYKLTGDDVPRCKFDPTRHSYNGSNFRPDPKCYAMITNAYSKANLARAGALAAEAACRRFEEYNAEEHANAFLLKGIVVAWLNAGDFKRASTWLQKMEDTYESTGHPSDTPDTMTYTLFMEALATSSGAFAREAGELSMEILHKMRRGYLFEGNLQVIPTRRTYVAVMRCQERSYQGIIAVNKIQKVFQQLQEDYELFGRPDSCKPTVDAAMSLVILATKCRGNMQAIFLVEEVLQGLQQRYEETGDPEYVPPEKMITLLLSAYSKVNPQSAERCSRKVEEVFSLLEKNGMVPSIFAVTAAIRAKVNDRSDASLEEAEKMMKKLESPDAVVYQSCKFLRAMPYFFLMPVANGVRIFSNQGLLQKWQCREGRYDVARIGGNVWGGRDEYGGMLGCVVENSGLL